jgi:uncharacterized protein YlzI (FlbEa/FlbD family)
MRFYKFNDKMGEVFIKSDAVEMLRRPMAYEHDGTVIMLSNGQSVIVKETMTEVLAKISGG